MGEANSENTLFIKKRKLWMKPTILGEKKKQKVSSSFIKLEAKVKKKPARKVCNS